MSRLYLFIKIKISCACLVFAMTAYLHGGEDKDDEVLRWLKNVEGLNVPVVERYQLELYFVFGSTEDDPAPLESRVFVIGVAAQDGEKESISGAYVSDTDTISVRGKIKKREGGIDVDVYVSYSISAPTVASVPHRGSFVLRRAFDAGTFSEFFLSSKSIVHEIDAGNKVDASGKFAGIGYRLRFEDTAASVPLHSDPFK